jgi:hypothetical protein
MQGIWDFIVRLRTWLIGVIGLVALFLPDLIDLAAQLLNAPQIAAVLPEGWKTWAAAIGFIALVWSRWRPATRAADPEVQVAKELKKAEYGATVVVESGGETKAVIEA